MKIIGMILKSKFPPDIRVEKELRALVAAGHKVVVLCEAESGKPAESDFQGATVLHWVDTKRFRKWDRFCFALIFVRPVWKAAIKRMIREYKLDVLHVHDLPLVKTAIKAKAGTSLKVVADFHENYPAGIKVWREWQTGFQNRFYSMLFDGYHRWKRYEAWAVKNADRVVAVVEEMKARLVEEYPEIKSKVVVVSNTEEDRFLSLASDSELKRQLGDQFNLLYIGGFGPHRGLDTAIEAMAYLTESNIRLVLVGAGDAEIESHLRSLTVQFGVEDKVLFYGWQPGSKVRAFMEACQVGLVPHHANEHTNHTIPHKLFQYMMVGVPVLVSSCPPLARVVEEAGAGLVFEAGNARSFSEQIRFLYQHPTQAQKFGAQAKTAAQGKFHFKFCGERLVLMYESL